MSKKLRLKIITPRKILVNEEVDAVFSHSTEGEFGILPDHIPYMTDLDIGVTEYINGAKKQFVSTIGGVIQVKENVVTILSDAAELGEEIDVPRAQAAKERAEALLRTGAPDIDINRAQTALARAVARINTASGKK
jgi:F-type H+-transporting ATPase subunit epsilon